MQQRGVIRALDSAVRRAKDEKGEEGFKNPYIEFDFAPKGESWQGSLAIRLNPRSIRTEYTGIIVGWKSRVVQISVSPELVLVRHPYIYCEGDRPTWSVQGFPDASSGPGTLENSMFNGLRQVNADFVDHRQGENPANLIGSSERSSSSRQLIIDSSPRGVIAHLEPILRIPAS